MKKRKREWMKGMRSAAAFLIAAALLIVSARISGPLFADEESTELTMKGQVSTTGQNQPEDLSFTVVLEAEDDETPMPEPEQPEEDESGEEGDDSSGASEPEPSSRIAKTEVGANEEFSFGPIVYTDLGDYHYTLRQEVYELDGLTIDEREYELTVYVRYNTDDELVWTVTAIDSTTEEKAPELLFENVYVDPISAIEVTKTVSSFESSEPAIFVFEVEAVLEDEVVLSDVVALQFDAAGTKSAVVGPLHVGTEVTVTEIYSGSHYEPAGAATQSVTVIPNERAVAAFTNAYNGAERGGHGITNHFEYGGEAWSLSQQSDNEAPAVVEEEVEENE